MSTVSGRWPFNCCLDMKIKGKKVAVLMSGGVDSSVAAVLLQQQGFEVIGITLQLWDYDTVARNPRGEQGCCDISQQIDARHVCAQIGVPHYVLDLRKDFRDGVVHPYERAYLDGITPNPCVWCNSKVKWGAVLPRAAQMGFDYIATGHYANIVRGRNGVRLEKGDDPAKDQSYALWEISKQALEKTVLPLGHKTKTEIRRIAADLELKTAHKSESQEVCFIPDTYDQYLRELYPDEIERIGAGDIVTTAGEHKGMHSGFFSYTIGQRKGLNISDGKGPYYVTEIQRDSNRVIVGADQELFRPGLIAHSLNWVSFDEPKKPERCTVKIRYNDRGVPATAFPIENGRLEIRFRSPQRAVTPGQSVVWYKGRAVWGGGMIARAIVR
ncbi:tRNA 2-thiouridine(34) synthase MnmA [bacterium]|nr:tRNA 2-thiouridine(34) synthase MnmA [bacterium]